LLRETVLLAARPLAQEGTFGWYELQGLLGRCAKQIFLDSPDRSSDRARQYLDEAIIAYRTAYQKEPTKAFWHGGNIAALLTISRSLGGPAMPDTDPVTFSQGLKQVLDKVSDVDNPWWHATYVEAELGAKNWSAAAERLQSFLDAAREPFPALNELDAPYLPLVVQEAAGVPLGPTFSEQKKILKRCHGLFYRCAGGAEARRFNRLLIEAGLITGL
jgi:hypothetical protein